MKKIMSFLLVLVLITGICGFNESEANILDDLEDKFKSAFNLPKAVVTFSVNQAKQTADVFQNVPDYREIPRVIREGFNILLGEKASAAEGVIEMGNDALHRNVTPETVESFFKALDGFDSVKAKGIKNILEVMNDYQDPNSVLYQLEEDSWYFTEQARGARKRGDTWGVVKNGCLALAAEMSELPYATSKVLWNTTKDTVESPIKKFREVVTSGWRIKAKFERSSSKAQRYNSSADQWDSAAETIHNIFDFENAVQYYIENNLFSPDMVEPIPRTFTFDNDTGSWPEGGLTGSTWAESAALALFG